MRLFVALPVDEPARAELARVLAALAATDWPVRWTHDDGFHVTLKFFADAPAERVPDIEAKLRTAVADVDLLELQLTELGAFPSTSRPRVLWAGIAASPALELLQHGVERELERVGFPGEGRPFRPHVTLGRVRDGARLPPRALEAADVRLEPVGFAADHVVLYESVLGPGGARHLPRLTLTLGRSWAA